MIEMCASCRRSLEYAKATGYSSLYNPGNDKGILLCEPCFFAEDALIEEKGGNDIPEELQRYKNNLELGVL